MALCQQSWNVSRFVCYFPKSASKKACFQRGNKCMSSLMAKWRHMALNFMANSNSDHGLNVWTNADMLQIGLSGIYFSDFFFSNLGHLLSRKCISRCCLKNDVLSRCVIYGSLLTGQLIASTAFHDDSIKWKHFPRYWPFVRGIHRWPVNYPHFFFDLRLNKRLSKQSWGWWSEMPSRPLWRHRNVSVCRRPHLFGVHKKTRNLIKKMNRATESDFDNKT